MGTQGLVRLSADHRDMLAAFLEIEHDLVSNFEGHWKPAGGYLPAGTFTRAFVWRCSPTSSRFISALR